MRINCGVLGLCTGSFDADLDIKTNIITCNYTHEDNKCITTCCMQCIQKHSWCREYSGEEKLKFLANLLKLKVTFLTSII